MFHPSGYHAAKNWHMPRNSVPLFVTDSVAACCCYCYVRERNRSGYHAAKNWHSRAGSRRVDEKKPGRLAGLRVSREGSEHFDELPLAEQVHARDIVCFAESVDQLCAFVSRDRMVGREGREAILEGLIVVLHGHCDFTADRKGSVLLIHVSIGRGFPLPLRLLADLGLRDQLAHVDIVVGQKLADTC